MKHLAPAVALLITSSMVSMCQEKTKSISIHQKNITECIVCERIDLFKRVKELVSEKIWKGLNNDAHIQPLLYFTDSNTYVAFGQNKFSGRLKYDTLKCDNGLSLFKLTRMDNRPFHMENKMSFTDTGSLYYYQPMMLCSDAEAMNKVVPDFDKTEDWLQLVMHEYFHSFQFSHKATIDYLAKRIEIAADTLDKIYMQHKWFQQSLEKENAALLSAIGSTDKDSLGPYIKEFIQARENRIAKYEKTNKLDLNTMEKFWETMEGTARYVEYYMAGNFSQIPKTAIQCDSLFNRFKDYEEASNFEDKPEFRTRTQIMPAYYYVIGFNLCRLMDKMNINYKQGLFDGTGNSLYDIFIKNIKSR
jgi:hypothetical protein